MKTFPPFLFISIFGLFCISVAYGHPHTAHQTTLDSAAHETAMTADEAKEMILAYQNFQGKVRAENQERQPDVSRYKVRLYRIDHDTNYVVLFDLEGVRAVPAKRIPLPDSPTLEFSGKRLKAMLAVYEDMQKTLKGKLGDFFDFNVTISESNDSFEIHLAPRFCEIYWSSLDANGKPTTDGVVYSPNPGLTYRINRMDYSITRRSRFSD